MNSARRYTPARQQWHEQCLNQEFSDHLLARMAGGKLKNQLGYLISQYPTTTGYVPHPKGLTPGARTFLKVLIEIVGHESFTNGDPCVYLNFADLDERAGSPSIRRYAMDQLLDAGFIIDTSLDNGQKFKHHERSAGISLRPLLTRLFEIEQIVEDHLMAIEELKSTQRALRRMRNYIASAAARHGVELNHPALSVNFKVSRHSLAKLKELLQDLSIVQDQLVRLDEALQEQAETNKIALQGANISAHKNITTDPIKGLTSLSKPQNEAIVEPKVTRYSNFANDAKIAGPSLSEPELEPLLAPIGGTNDLPKTLREFAQKAGIRLALVDRWLDERPVTEVAAAFLLEKTTKNPKEIGKLTCYWMNQSPEKLRGAYRSRVTQYAKQAAANL